MKEEIRQNGHSVLHSEDGYSIIGVIFNNLTGVNFKGAEYTAYLEGVLPQMGLEYGKVEMYRDGVRVKSGYIG